MFSDDGVEFLLQFLNLTSSNLDVAGLTLCTTHRLVNHHTAVRQSKALAFLTGYQQDCGHRSGHTCADGRHVALDELHGVVDSQTCVHTATRRVHVDVDVLA